MPRKTLKYDQICPISAWILVIFQSSETDLAHSKLNRSRSFSNRFCFLMAQNVALIPYVHLPCIRAAMLSFLACKNYQNSNFQVVYFNSPPPVRTQNDALAVSENWNHLANGTYAKHIP